MQLQFNKVYHLYNRSNNRELLFKKKENYRYFLRKFKVRFVDYLSVYAYCLMPTHFHFLIRVETKEIDELRKQIGTHLSSYTKAINKAFDRNGSLFQQHTKAQLVDDQNYLLTLISYIHQNPVRARLVNNLKEWRYSSYLDLAGYRKGSLVDHSIIDRYFSSKEEYREFSKRRVSFK
ncbi:transposase [Aliifodinibius salipaludis]|uniref:Transposase n=1 Tax=Fodinibius salipaludis TaxID=2032627 RepID=A0A2A2G5K2_9BACT|nr:transposase [Aliifodinibius salipaludis]PAU92921.1 transposase [Aliifodinibius salipaludis]